MVASGKVYAATSDGVWAFDRSSGKVLWKSSVGSWIMRPPQVIDGVLYVSAGGLSALDADSGALLWKFNPGPELSRPIIVDGMAYISDNDGSSLYVIRTGKD